jgi:sarcosine oxidase, subunit gamma
MRLKWSAPISSIQRGTVCVHDLIATTALGKSAPAVDHHGSVILTEEPGIALASVTARRGGERTTALALRRMIGPTAPKAGHWAGTRIIAFWTGPDQWMLEAPYDSDEFLFERAIAEVKGKASVTEQTGAWCRFDLRGPNLTAVMERLCPINMAQFIAGSATRTSIHHLGCFVLCRAQDHISILGPRSCAASLHHSLLTAIRAAF